MSFVCNNPFFFVAVFRSHIEQLLAGEGQGFAVLVLCWLIEDFCFQRIEVNVKKYMTFFDKHQETIEYNTGIRPGSDSFN